MGDDSEGFIGLQIFGAFVVITEDIPRRLRSLNFKASFSSVNVESKPLLIKLSVGRKLRHNSEIHFVAHFP